MADKNQEPTQQAQPRKGELAEIPLPTRKDVVDLMKGVSGRRSQGDEPKTSEDEPSEG
jgi:hypothetical protein